MSISEQVKELRRIAEEWNPNCPINPVSATLNQAADTIESLSAKLEDIERPDNHCEDSVFEKIISDLDKMVGTQLKIIAGLNDETRKYGYGKALEAYQQSKLMVEISFEEYKEKRSAEDCGGGWIPCKRKMPEIGKPVLVCDKQ